MIDEILLEKHSGEDRDIKAIRKFLILNNSMVFSDRKDEIEYLKNVLDKDKHRLFVEQNYNHYYIYSDCSGFDSDVYLKEYGEDYSYEVEEREDRLIKKIISIYKGQCINLHQFLKEKYTSVKELKLLVDEGKAEEKEDGKYYWVENEDLNKNMGNKEYLERLSKLFGGDAKPKAIYYLTSNYTEGGLEVQFILKKMALW